MDRHSTATAEPTGIDLTDPRSFGFWSTDITRWGDTDALGHINNVEFARYFETGRIRYLHDIATAMGGPRPHYLLVSLAIHFRAEMFYPGTARVGSRVLHIGRSSVRFGQGLFQDDRCTATAESVVVHVDPTGHRPAALVDPMRALLADFTGDV